MKKNILVFVIMIAFLGLNAQITVTNSDVADAGSTFSMSTDTIPSTSIVPGEAGENKNWNFSNLKNHEEYEIEFMLPEWTPYDTAFPFANFAALMSDEDSAYAFFNRDDDELAAIGLVGSYDDFGEFVVDIEPKEVYLDFPVQYGDSRSENFYFEVMLGGVVTPFDSIRFKQTTIKNTLVDAWGNLAFTLGSYDVLRIREDQTIVDSTWGKTFGFWTLIVTDVSDVTEFQWISNDISLGYSLIEMDYYPDTELVGDVSFMNAFPVGIKEEFDVDVNVYPNPTKDNITFSFENTFKGYITIYDTYGRLVSESIINSKTINIELSNISPGIYFYNVQNQKQETVKQGKLIKE